MVASRRSGVIRTSGTVIMCPSSTGSCTSPRISISASAWRISSPTRSWRCDDPVRVGSRGRRMEDLQRTLNCLHSITFDDVACPHVLVILKGHAAFLAGDNFAGIVFEAFELRQLT